MNRFIRQATTLKSNRAIPITPSAQPSPKQQKLDLTKLDPSQIKPQFTHQPIRPSPQSDSLRFLPPAPFILTIISLSYNRQSVHSLLSPNFPASKSIRFIHPAGHFMLTAIHQRLVNLSTPIPSHIRTLNSCFRPEDQELWKVRREERRKNKNKKKPNLQLRLTFSLRIKELHKSSVIRKTIRKRWISALKLIVQYGAHLSPSANNPNLIPSLTSTPTPHDLIQLNSNDSGFDRWLDKDYYYIVHPNISLNSVGLVELIRSIRLGLESIKRSIQINNTKTNRYNHNSIKSQSWSK